MKRMETVGDVHAVVFERYRRRVPLLENKVGTPVNPEGIDLWVLCPSEDEARRIFQYGEFGINEYVTSARRHTYERHIPVLPPDAAVVFSKTAGDDHAIMGDCHPHLERLAQKVTWRKGTYYLEVETAHFDRYVTRESRIGPDSLERDEFHAQLVVTSRRLAKKAPHPFEYGETGLVLSAAAAALLAHLTAPAATTFRHWLDLDADCKENRRLVLSSTSFEGEETGGVEAVTFERHAHRLRSTIVYTDGSVLNDLGLRISTRLPDSVLHASVGMDIDRIVSAAGLGQWTVHEVDLDSDQSYFGIRIPAVPLEPPVGLPPLPADQAQAKLARLLARDLRSVRCIEPILREMDGNGLQDPSVPYVLRAGLDVVGVLGVLGPEVAGHLVSEVTAHDACRPATLAPWLGQGRLERNVDQLTISDAPPIPLVDTCLVQGNARP